MKSLMRIIFRGVCRLYPFENGKYKLLKQIYFKFLAPKEKKEVISKIIFDIKMKLDLTEYIQAYLYNYGSYELPTIKFIEKTVKPGHTIIDIGGNVGLMTLIFAKLLNSTGKVFTFEPEPRNNKKLYENIELNKFNNIQVFQNAVSDKKDKLKLYLSGDNNSGIHSLIYNDDLKNEYVEVDTLILDEFVKESYLTKIDIIKIDVEGAELDVINGMQNVLKNQAPIIIMEVVSKYLKNRKTSAVEFKKFMYEKFGYKAYQILDNGEIILDPEEKENVSDNVVFIKSNNQ